MAVYALGPDVPDIHPEAWVHPEAVVIGMVRIGRGSSVWRYGTSPPSDTQLLPMRECLHEDSRDVFAC